MPKIALLASGCTTTQQPDSKYFVSYWYIPNGSDYDQARVVKLFFSEDYKEEVEKIVARYDYPPEMPVICKL